MEIERGALVWTTAEDSQRRPARVVIGPHQSGEFEVVVLCEPEDWETVQAEGRPTEDYWGEACFVWPVEAIEHTPPNSWHEEMRARALAFLVTVDDRLPRDTAELAHELIDANEYGVAVEIMREVLRERQATLTVEEQADLEGMLTAMGLESSDP